MITLRFAHLFLILLITGVAFAGCQKRKQRTEAPVDQQRRKNPLEGLTINEQWFMEGDPVEEMVATPVKMVWFINFPEGGKETYNDWVASVAETFQAPELVRSRIYDNVDPEQRPHRYVEMEFESFLDAATYMNRPEIAALLQEATDYVTDQSVHTFIQRSDYLKNEAGDWSIKIIRLIDYTLGGKQAYLDWATSSSRPLVEQPALKVAAGYDNYYGTSPHRLITIELASQVELVAWKALEIRKTFDAGLDKHVDSWKEHTFELQADYIRE